MNTKEIDVARAFLYNTLALLFVEEHVKNNSKNIIESLEVLSQNGFDDETTKICLEILEDIKSDETLIYDEYQKLFLIPFGKSIALSASWYHEEREGGVMLVNVRQIVAKTKIRKDEKLFKAPEDHFGFIFTLSNYLISQQIDNKEYKDLQKELFVEILNPYIEQLYFKLLSCDQKVYPKIAVLLGNFMGLERSYLNI